MKLGHILKTEGLTVFHDFLLINRTTNFLIHHSLIDNGSFLCCVRHEGTESFLQQMMRCKVIL